MIALYIVAAVVLLIVVWDLSGRRSLKRFRLLEENTTKKPKYITPLQPDPLLSYAKFFYETAFKKQSDFERALTMLDSTNTCKMRVGNNILNLFLYFFYKLILIYFQGFFFWKTFCI